VDGRTDGRTDILVTLLGRLGGVNLITLWLQFHFFYEFNDLTASVKVRNKYGLIRLFLRYKKSDNSWIQWRESRNTALTDDKTR